MNPTDDDDRQATRKISQATQAFVLQGSDMFCMGLRTISMEDY
jgi:hypothetical protein